MSFFKKIASALGGGFIKQATGLIDNLVTSDEEREQLKIQLKKAVHEHEETMHRLAHENTASARDMQKSALAQDDRFSKRFVYYLAALLVCGGYRAYVFSGDLYRDREWPHCGHRARLFNGHDHEYDYQLFLRQRGST